MKKMKLFLKFKDIITKVSGQTDWEKICTICTNKLYIVYVKTPVTHNEIQFLKRAEDLSMTSINKDMEMIRKHEKSYLA